MTKLKNTVEKLNSLLQEGKIMEAFDKYYSEDVIIQVNGNHPVSGKESNKDREAIFFGEIEKLNSAEVKTITFGGLKDNIAMTEWAINIQNKEGESKIINRVNVQHWKENRIVSERLYFCGDQKF